jgi:hypothetical protein
MSAADPATDVPAGLAVATPGTLLGAGYTLLDRLAGGRTRSIAEPHGIGAEAALATVTHHGGR